MAPQRAEHDPEREPRRDARTGRSAAQARMAEQHRWVELQLRQAVERGDFDDLPGFGRPLQLKDEHDPDWWVKQLIEREQVTGVLPAALQLRVEDTQLDDHLDRLASPTEVRRHVTDFNDRVRHALYSNPGGPPLVTRQKDVEEEVRRWAARREARLNTARPQDGPGAQRADDAPRAWWRRRR